MAITKICDFLLVRHSNLGHILHRFWDTATYWLKIAYFFLPLSHSAPRSLRFLWNFVVHEETRVMRLLCGESCMIITTTVFDWSTRVTDRRTDRRTDGRAIAYSALSIMLSRANKIKYYTQYVRQDEGKPKSKNELLMPSITGFYLLTYLHIQWIDYNGFFASINRFQK